MEAALRAIAGPRRRQILTLVRDAELSAGEIAAQFDVTRPAVSQDLTLLKEAGLAPLKSFLDAFWDDRLEALKRESGREERKKRGRRD